MSIFVIVVQSSKRTNSNGSNGGLCARTGNRSPAVGSFSVACAKSINAVFYDVTCFGSTSGFSSLQF